LERYITKLRKSITYTKHHQEEGIGTKMTSLGLVNDVRFNIILGYKIANNVMTTCMLLATVSYTSQTKNCI